MPILNNIELANEKKLDLTLFFENVLSENETEAFITIKKMPYTLKRKVSIMTMESMGGKIGKQYLKQAKAQGLKLDELDKLNPEQEMEIMIGMDINLEEQEKMNQYGLDVEKLILEKCIDPLKHNFFDNNGKLIEINNYEFWERIGNEKLVKYIITEIRNFSEGFCLKKKIATE